MRSKWLSGEFTSLSFLKVHSSKDEDKSLKKLTKYQQIDKAN